MKVGGAAEWLLEPTTPQELREAWLAARERELPIRVLGGGANLLVAEGLLPGAVIATGRMARTFRVEEGELDPLAGPELPSARLAPPPRAQGGRLVAWCGAGLPGLVRAAAQLGWSGIEGLVGVPGNAGGGVAMNAGGRWGELWEVVESVLTLDPDGELRQRAREDCAPTYRDARLSGAIVAAVVLRLTPDDPARVAERTREHLLEKKASQPLTESSSGCIFKNPDPERSGGRSAGRLIEECGLKGLAQGRASVSHKHANFIVNQGGARASEVFALIEEVRARVAEHSGILLELEVKRWEP
jgi:UDP-N-acetylmuramate dehydrogenase